MADNGALENLVRELDRKLEKLWTQLDRQLSDQHLEELVRKAIAESKAMSELKQQISEIKKT